MKQMTGWNVLRSWSDLRLISGFSMMGLTFSLSVLRFADAWAADMANTWMSTMS